MDESTIQAKIRLRASTLGWKVWRNNVGVLMDSRGVPVRFGLANDSKAVNSSFKSADLIGIRPLLITPGMVGKTIGQFVSIECKAPGGKVAGAQIKWKDLINSLGGFATITSDEI